jgi:hypothetical protein
MIVARLIGGLGNQMFEYAAARALSLRTNASLVLDISGFKQYNLHAYGLNHFNIAGDVFNQVEYVDSDKSKYVVRNPKSLIGRISRRLKLGQRLKVFRETDLVFNADMLTVRGDTYLEGYWQSEQYFVDQESQIRSDFGFRSNPDEINQHWLDRINSVLAVSVHIRRGDYVTDPAANAIHGVCSVDYYQRAVEFLKSRIASDLFFFVFSDDPEWSKNNIDFGANTFFISHNDASKNYEDLRLMSACKHHIIANSSFSWWGAWLNGYVDKIVVAPKRWFEGEEHDARDLVPAKWIRL